MKSSSYLCVLVVLLGVFLFTLAGGEGGGVDLTTDSPAAGRTMTGVASETGATWIHVKIFLDGKLVFEDDVMEGDLNEFEYDVPADAKGKHLKIVATSDKGSRTTKSYEVG
jgi:hypothetical protein